MEHAPDRGFEAWLHDERRVISFHTIPNARYFTATELLAGNVPDLLDCSDFSGAQYAGYAKNGILLPLDGMPESELLSGILKPCYVDGALYSIVGAFAIDPLFGPASKLGASLETSALDVLRGAVPSVRFFWGGEDLLGVYCRHAAEQYLDYDSQTASFESEKFLNILTACADIVPTEFDADCIMQQPMRSVSMYRSMQSQWYQQTGDAFRVLALGEDGAGIGRQRAGGGAGGFARNAARRLSTNHYGYVPGLPCRFAHADAEGDRRAGGRTADGNP